VSHQDISLEDHASELAVPLFRTPTKKLAMWLFIIADSATFAACLVAYGFLRNATPNWPHPFHSVTNAALMTFILISSSLTMLFAIESARVEQKQRAFRWIILTAVLGFIFALLHLREWFALIGEGMRMFKNPWGTGIFGASFFSITGLHLLHVSGGVVALVAVGFRYLSGRYGADDIETTGLYWHFVDLVWMFVVPLVYLLNYSPGAGG
jgi:cytochrome c oxidase subunit III